MKKLFIIYSLIFSFIFSGASPIAAAEFTPDITNGMPVPTSNEEAMQIEPESAETFFTQQTARYKLDRQPNRLGRRIKVFYILAQDSADRAYDTDGTIFRTLKTAQTWFYNRTSRERINFDTYNNELEVTFVRLDQPASEMMGVGKVINNTYSKLESKGLLNASAYNLIFYDAPVYAYCNATTGRFSFLFLRGTRDACTSVTPGIAGQFKYYEYAALATMGMAQGVPASCAPHKDPNGYGVLDDRGDLLYSGPNWILPKRVDSNRDDYYQTGNPNCLDFTDTGILKSFSGIPRQDYYDVPKGAWYEDGLSYATYYDMLGIARYYYNFSPDYAVARKDVAFGLWKTCKLLIEQNNPFRCAHSNLLDTAPDSGYDDVPPNAYYEKAANWVSYTDILDECCGRFDPDGAVYRETATVAVWRAFNSPVSPNVEPMLSDVPQSHHYYDAINSARSLKWMKQRQFKDNAFRPLHLMTRAEWADLIAY